MSSNMSKYYMSNIILYVKMYFISSINVYIYIYTVYYLSYCISWSTNQPVNPTRLAFP